MTQFHDQKLMEIIEEIKKYDPISFGAAIESSLKRLIKEGLDENVHFVLSISTLNQCINNFCKLDDYYQRENKKTNKDTIDGICHFFRSSLGDGPLLEGASLTSALDTSEAANAISSLEKRSHAHVLNNAEYERLQKIQDLVSIKLIHSYLPSRYKDAISGFEERINEELKGHLGPEFTLKSFQELRTLVDRESSRGRITYKPDENFLKKFGPFVASPQQLRKITLDHFYYFPPQLIKFGKDKYHIMVQNHTNDWIDQKQLGYFNQIKSAFPDAPGDTMELMMKEYITGRILVSDLTSTDGVKEMDLHTDFHFVSAMASFKLARNENASLFAVLDVQNKEEIHIDLTANHTEGFSILAEIKFFGKYEKARAHYEEGADAEGSGRDKLLKLCRYLNEHPVVKKDLYMPEENIVIPVYITNAIGEFFSRNDGVVKASPFEVMKVVPFYHLIKEKAVDKCNIENLPS